METAFYGGGGKAMAFEDGPQQWFSIARQQGSGGKTEYYITIRLSAINKDYGGKWDSWRWFSMVAIDGRDSIGSG